jgi:hypothetical protein
METYTHERKKAGQAATHSDRPAKKPTTNAAASNPLPHHDQAAIMANACGRELLHTWMDAGRWPENDLLPAEMPSQLLREIAERLHEATRNKPGVWQDYFPQFLDREELRLEFMRCVESPLPTSLSACQPLIEGIRRYHKERDLRGDLVPRLLEKLNSGHDISREIERLKEIAPVGGGAIPDNIFPVPNTHVTYDAAAQHIFSAIAETKKIFMRNGTPHEVVGNVLRPITPERFVSMLETFGRRIAKYEFDRKTEIGRWRTSLMPTSSANVLLQSKAVSMLPNINIVLASPIIARCGHEPPELERLGPGYHENANGGTFIINSDPAPAVPFDVAVAKLREIIADFDFPTLSDASRAVASFISPAMKLGGFINDDFPLDLAEADQSQSGKTYRQNLVCAIYGEEASSATSHTGGVGSLNESVSRMLIDGRPFLQLDNIRGRVDSNVMETAIRGAGLLRCRALRQEALVNTRPFLWQLSTNGAELTRDLANRSIITRIRKRPESYQFKVYPEGDLKSHIKANQPFFLGCVHAIVAEWWRLGGQETSESRHDFRRWVRVMDWIVQNLFHLPPLLDGHREEQLRTANPRLQWLREIAAVLDIRPDLPGITLTASEIANVCEENGIDFPTPAKSTRDPALTVGKILAGVFRDITGDSIRVDQYEITRITEMFYCPNRQEHREQKKYRFTKP